MTTINAQINSSAKISAKSLVIGGVSKRSLGLDAVDNTSDLDKPISTAQQTAIDLKADQATTYTKTEVDVAISSLIADAPGALDTLNELAAALGDDENFATNITNDISSKADKSAVGDLTNLVVAFTGTARDSLVAAVNKNNGDIGSTASRSLINSGNITTLNATTPHNTDSVVICNDGDNIQDKLDEAGLLQGGTLIVMAGQYGDLSLTDDNLQANIIGIGNPTIGNVDDEGTFLTTGATYKNFTCNRFFMNLPGGNIENITTTSYFSVYDNYGTIKDIKTGTNFVCNWNAGTIDDISCQQTFISDFAGNFGTIKNVNAATIYVENNNGTVDNVNATGDLITNNDGITKNCSAGGKFELSVNNGIIDNCHSNGTDRGFGGYLGSWNAGTIKNCTSKGARSFGEQTATGVTENCTAVLQGFGGTFSQIIPFVGGGGGNGTYKNCSAGIGSFFGVNADTTNTRVMLANYIDCTAQQQSFGYCNTSGATTVFSGTAKNCTAGFRSFAGADAGNAQISTGAIIENCSAGNFSFASDNPNTINSGIILRCRTTSLSANAFGVDGATGKVRLCLNGNYGEVNIG